MKRVLSIVVIGLLVSLVLPVTAHAQRSVVITITEEEFNTSYRAQNPAFRTVSNVKVDLQPGKAVVSATLTYRRAGTYGVVVSFVPTVANGRITWSVSSATINGSPATSSQITQMNNQLGASWGTFVRGQLPRGRVTAVTITETDMQITVQ